MSLSAEALLIFITVILLVIAVGFTLWWLLVATEGVYLGRRVVIWLYDLYAARYDRIKEYQPEYEYYFLARPILGEIYPQFNPLVLDVATGTGRLPIALCDHEDFAGRVIATDLSRNMLLQAAKKLEGESRVVFLRCAGEHLPFAANSFDVVTCLEALEFTESPAATLRECVRVLRPGGVLLITNRRNTRMPGRLWTEEQIHALLADYGVGISQTEPWQTDYQKVWGLKDGDSDPIGTISAATPPDC
jgi:ubiquinone/menaquinone biosynthesis C-methylase UbiE